MYHTYFLATDKLKDAIIAKIAMQAADLYADAYSNMQVGSVKQMWDKVPPSHMILIWDHVTVTCTVELVGDS